MRYCVWPEIEGNSILLSAVIRSCNAFHNTDDRSSESLGSFAAFGNDTIKEYSAAPVGAR